MPKQLGPHFVTGRLEGFSFYRRRGQYLVRRQGGPSRQRVLHAPAFAGTRAHLGEFGRCSALGKGLRRALGAQFALPDRQLYRRLTRLLWQVLQCDTQHERGERCVQEGLRHWQGRALLRGFAFYPGGFVQDGFMCGVRLLAGGDVLVDASRLRWPAGASSVQLRVLGLSAEAPLHAAGQRAYRPLRWQGYPSQRLLRVQATHSALPHPGEVAPVLLFLQLCFFVGKGAQAQPLAGGMYDSLQALCDDEGAARCVDRRSGVNRCVLFIDRPARLNRSWFKLSKNSKNRVYRPWRQGEAFIRAG